MNKIHIWVYQHPTLGFWHSFSNQGPNFERHDGSKWMFVEEVEMEFDSGFLVASNLIPDVHTLYEVVQGTAE